MNNTGKNIDVLSDSVLKKDISGIDKILSASKERLKPQKKCEKTCYKSDKTPYKHSDGNIACVGDNNLPSNDQKGNNLKMIFCNDEKGNRNGFITGIYKQKYLKYKQKYLELKKQYNNTL